MEFRTPLFFVHGNGFTPGAYRQMLEPLNARFSVSSFELLPLRHEVLPSADWRVLAEDVGAELDRAGQPVIGVGHSLGAITLLLSAVARPERYRRLVLIDPVALPPWKLALLHRLPASLRRHGPLAKAARNRVDRWSNVDDAFAHMRRRRWLARVSDSVLRDILQHGLKDDGNAVTLRFRTEWEAVLYESPPNIWQVLKQQLLPITVLYGRESTLFDQAAVRRWKAMRPADEMVGVEGAGHLLPLELPGETARIILTGKKEGFDEAARYVGSHVDSFPPTPVN